MNRLEKPRAGTNGSSRAHKALPKSPAPHVALLVDTLVASGRDILRGIGRYVREHQRWALIHVQTQTAAGLPGWLKNWKGDGIIVRAHDSRLVDTVKDIGVPAVDVLGELSDCPLPLVHVDNKAIAKLAADHLIERGFRHFGFFGLTGRMWSERRRDAFREYLAGQKFRSEVYEQSSEDRFHTTWESRESRLSEWIHRLPKPAGVFVCSDQVGLDFLEACRHAGVAVPDEVAVVGVDNDGAFCEIANPSLSSIWPCHTQVGYRAAELLDRLMAGGRAPKEPIFIAPGGVKTRQSSDVLAIDDLNLAKAINIIRADACTGISVDEVAHRAGMSRSVLQRRFRVVLGKTVHEEILAAKIKRACQLLEETEFPLAEVAERCGFGYQEYLGAVFRRHLQQTPAEYRRTRRVRRASAERQSL